MRYAFTILMAIGSCATPGPPDPVEPGPPTPGTPCEQAHARALELGCEGAQLDQWVQACELYARESGDARWDPACMARASSCDAQERCRRGVP